MNMGQNGCTTFIALDEKGGLPSVHAHVGACQKADCTFNDHLECVAEKIRVSAGECQTFNFWYKSITKGKALSDYIVLRALSCRRPHAKTARSPSCTKI